MPNDTDRVLANVLGCAANTADVIAAVEVLVALVDPNGGVLERGRQPLVDRVVELERQLAAERDGTADKQRRREALGSIAPVQGRFRASVGTALRRGKTWTIGQSDYERLTWRPCAYCGGDTGRGIGLDRVDNRKGYDVDNVVPCCGPCNIRRGRQNQESFSRTLEASA